MPVMQQQNVPSSQLIRELSEHDIGVAFDRVEAASRPAREPQIETCQHGIEEWVAKSGGCAKETWTHTRNGADCFLRTVDFLCKASRAEEREIMKMSLAVVLDRMATMHDLARDVGVLPD